MDGDYPDEASSLPRMPSEATRSEVKCCSVEVGAHQKNTNTKKKKKHKNTWVERRLRAPPAPCLMSCWGYVVWFCCFWFCVVACRVFFVFGCFWCFLSC